jgi:hypothetical protein
MEQHSKPVAEAARQAAAVRPAHCDELIDQALMDTFPASDPISPMYFD